MGGKRTRKNATGPGGSDTPGPGGKGGIVPAPTPSSSHDGREDRDEDMMSTNSSEVMSEEGHLNPDAVRPEALLPGLTWEKDLAPWWNEFALDTPTAELFLHSLKIWRKARKEVDELNEYIDQLVEEEKGMSPFMREARGFASRMRGLVHQQTDTIAELTRRECARLGEDETGVERLCIDRGTQTKERVRVPVGTQTEEAPATVAPLPGELVDRLEEISSRLAANSDRLGLVERRLARMGVGRSRRKVRVAREVSGEGSMMEIGTGTETEAETLTAGTATDDTTKTTKTDKGKTGRGVGETTEVWAKVVGRGSGRKERGEGRRGEGMRDEEKVTAGRGGRWERRVGGGATAANVMGVPRCYRCLCVGHTWRRCTSAVDRGSRCYRCGSPGHKEVGCLSGLRCPLCVDFRRPARHRLGGPGCLTAPPVGSRGGGVPPRFPSSAVVSTGAAVRGGGGRGARQIPASLVNAG